jgi:hypothetical protein
MPIEMASEIGRTVGGLAVWCLHAHGADVPGPFIIVDREFWVVEP